MSEKKVYRAIGLMSGTSLDGVDAALIDTDGYTIVKPLDFVTIPYTAEEREAIRAAFGQKKHSDVVEGAEKVVTSAHIRAVEQAAWGADIIGFHGQTIYHAPGEGVTVQIGDGQAMADALKIDVVADFRTNDVAHGGQGAPLAPLYHGARAFHDDVELPAIFLNIGGVANITYVDREHILAFDTGPGNALLDDWTKLRTGQAFDKDGELSSSGQILDNVLSDWLQHPYFNEKPPKSLDRDEWDIADFGRHVRCLEEISDADGAATLLAFTTETIKRARDFLPEAPKAWYLCGGGRHNDALVTALAKDLPVRMVEDLGWNGDATEAECFGYLAVRSLLGEPLSRPTTTGIAKPLSGGVLHKP
ncbi:MAG: anhydro-N-acetylmuramic acid kinase [Pseudomonadota bacterium]